MKEIQISQNSQIQQMQTSIIENKIPDNLTQFSN